MRRRRNVRMGPLGVIGGRWERSSDTDWPSKLWTWTAFLYGHWIVLIQHFPSTEYRSGKYVISWNPFLFKKGKNQTTLDPDDAKALVTERLMRGFGTRDALWLMDQFETDNLISYDPKQPRQASMGPYRNPDDFEKEALRAARHNLESAQSLIELAQKFDEQGESEAAAAHYLDAYAHVSAAHLILDLGAGDDEAFDQAEELRTLLHEELLERLGVPFVSADEIDRIQQRRRQRWRMRVIPGGKRENNTRKRRLQRL